MTFVKKPNYDEMFTDYIKAQQLTKTCKRKLEIHINKKPTTEILNLISSNAFASPSLSLKINSPPKALSVSTVASDSETSKYDFKNQKSKEDPEFELLQKLTTLGSKMEKVVEMFYEFEQVFLADRLLNKPKLASFRRESRRILGMVAYNFKIFKKQQAINLGLSILYLTAKKIGIEDNEFSFQASKVLGKERSVKVKSVKRSKCYGMIKGLKVFA